MECNLVFEIRSCQYSYLYFYEVEILLHALDTNVVSQQFLSPQQLTWQIY